MNIRNAITPFPGWRHARPQGPHGFRDEDHARTRLVKQVLAGASIAVAVLAGIYAVAATTASSIAGSFDTTHSESHSRRIAFQSEVTRTSAGRAAALQKCDQGTRRERSLCKASVRVDEERIVLRSLYPRAPKP